MPWRGSANADRDARLHSLCFRWLRSITHGLPNCRQRNGQIYHDRPGVAGTPPRPVTSTVGMPSRPGVLATRTATIPVAP
jgi:hypothetical protein